MVLITRYFEGHFAKDVKKIFAVFLICCAPVVGLFHFLAFDMYHKVFVLFRLPVAFLLQQPLKEMEDLQLDQVIQGGMIPKVQSAKAAIKKGVGEVDIVLGTKGVNFNFGTRII
jgi:hypothetical protein